VTLTFIVSQGGLGQTIGFSAPPNQMVGATVALSASASSGLPVSFSTTTPLVCSVTGNTANPLSAGTCSITAAQGGNAAYSAAPSVTQAFSVMANLIFNGRFESGTLAPWQLLLTNDGQLSATAGVSSVSPADGLYSADVHIASAGTAIWHADFAQGSLAVIAGKQYTVKFWARASSARSIQLCLQGGAPSYSYYGLYTSQSIGTSWSYYTLTFVASATANDGMLEFRVGNVVGDVFLDDVELFATGN
jgi:hypothetical protein